MKNCTHRVLNYIEIRKLKNLIKSKHFNTCMNYKKNTYYKNNIRLIMTLIKLFKSVFLLIVLLI